MQLHRRLIEAQESTYAAEAPAYEAEAERFDALPDAFASGTWSREDVAWIVERAADDGADRRQRFERNDDDEVRERVNAAVEGSSVRTRVESLTALDGVDVPVAAAILQFVDPEQFVPLDERRWRTLRGAGYLWSDLTSDPGVEEYALYLGVCWALANEYDVGLRRLGMALWALDG